MTKGDGQPERIWTDEITKDDDKDKDTGRQYRAVGSLFTFSQRSPAESVAPPTLSPV